MRLHGREENAESKRKLYFTEEKFLQKKIGVRFDSKNYILQSLKPQ